MQNIEIFQSVLVIAPLYGLVLLIGVVLIALTRPKKPSGWYTETIDTLYDEEGKITKRSHKTVKKERLP